MSGIPKSLLPVVTPDSARTAQRGRRLRRLELGVDVLGALIAIAILTQGTVPGRMV